jgi:hypothetical protein
MNCPASTMTGCRELRGMGFHGRAAAHKPNISPVNAKRLLKLCKERHHWTVDSWKCVILGDESHYTMWQSDGRVWVLQMPGEWYLPAYVVPVVKYGGGGITVWGCFSWNWLGLLIILRGNLNAEGYKDILTHCILSTTEDQISDDSCLYQHDSASCHKARSVREWFVDNGSRLGLASPESRPESHRTPVGWIRTPTSLQTPRPHITNCSGYSSAGRMGGHSAGDVQTPGTKSPRQSSSCHKGKGWAHPVLMSTAGKCVTGKVELQFRVGVRILLIR